jgi:hypothetical protein
MFVVDSLLGLLVVFGLAYGLDFWVNTLRETGFRTFQMVPYIRGSILANIVISLALIALAWHALFRGQRNVIVAVIFLLAGTMVTLLPIILLNVPQSAPILSDPGFRVLRVSFLYSSTISRLQLSGALVMVIGLLGLVPMRTDRLRQMWERLWQVSS